MDSSTLQDNTALSGSKLCQHCGLCCTGTFFSHVYVEKDEIEQSKKAGLKLETIKDKTLFPQPCACYKANSCSVYKDRPSRCRGYSCILLKKVTNGEIPYHEAHELVTTMKGEKKWLMENKTAKSKTDMHKYNLHKYLKSYQKLAKKVNASSGLSSDDKTYIVRAFEFLKKLDRFFATSSSVWTYATLIQNFNTKPRTFKIKGHKITVVPKKK